MITNVGVSR